MCMYISMFVNLTVVNIHIKSQSFMISCLCPICYVFITNDILPDRQILIIYSNNTYVVTDYAKRNSLHVENLDSMDKTKKLFPTAAPSGFKNMFMVALLENHEQKQVELILSCKSP